MRLLPCLLSPLLSPAGASNIAADIAALARASVGPSWSKARDLGAP